MDEKHRTEKVKFGSLQLIVDAGGGFVAVDIGISDM